MNTQTTKKIEHSVIMDFQAKTIMRAYMSLHKKKKK